MNLIKSWNRLSLITRILIGFAIGLCLALAFPNAKVVGVLGQVFVACLKAIAPVLVGLLVTASIAKAKEGYGSRFRNIIGLYLGTTLMAAVLSVFGCKLLPITLKLSESAAFAAPTSLKDVFTNLLTSIVANPVRAVADANYLAVLFWSIILGLALKKLGGKGAINMISDLANACSELVRLIIQFAPLGILGLVYSAVAENGMSIFVEYGRLLALLVGCMLLTALVLNPAIVAFLLRRNPYPLVFKCLKESGISAFFTRSSAANIPVNMDLCKRMDVDEGFYSVSIPLGATINMNGAAVTITVMTLTLCNTLGIEVGIGSAILLSMVATLGACGSSGVAGGSLLLIPMACSLFGISQDISMQVVSIGFIIGVIQDSVETALNSSGDALFTIAVDMHNKRKVAAEK